MAANLSAKDKGTVVRALHYDMIDEVDHDQTRQRLFEQDMISLDHPDENGDLYDYGDCGRAAKRMFREMDAEYREKVIEPYRQHKRDLAFRRPLHVLKDHPELQTTLRAIRRCRVREKIISALKIMGEMYRERFSQMTQILKIPT